MRCDGNTILKIYGVLSSGCVPASKMVEGNDVTDLETLMKEHQAFSEELRTLIQKPRPNQTFVDVITGFVEFRKQLYELQKLDTKFCEYLFELVKQMVDEK